MILTVTCNPAYDVTYEVDRLTPGEVHRVRTVHSRAGGKGVNVAAVLAQLGVEVVATGVAPASFSADVDRLGVRSAFVGGCRRTVVVSGPEQATSFWEPGDTVDDGSAVAERLRARVDELLPKAGCLVVSGSLAPGLPDELPATLATEASRCGVPVVVDTSGVPLRHAAGVRGVVLMPNREELGELTSYDDPIRAGCALVSGGAGALVATRGHEGLVLTTAEGSWRGAIDQPLDGNPTGAGDAAAAAVARALADDLPPDELVRDAVALSAAAVPLPYAGAVDPELYAELRAAVRVERLER